MYANIERNSDVKRKKSGKLEPIVLQFIACLKRAQVNSGRNIICSGTALTFRPRPFFLSSSKHRYAICSDVDVVVVVVVLVAAFEL